MNSKLDQAPHKTSGKKITIKFILDESTKNAMKEFEAKRFKKRIERDMKLLSRHKIFR